MTKLSSSISSPRISVVMSVYNEPVEWMRLSIDSILNQTYSDFEFIIINDKPDRDENAQLLNEYAQKDNRIKIITNEENIGLTKSLNKGLEIAKGKYIARMDADDICRKERLQIQYNYMESHQDVDLCGTWGRSFGNLSWLSLKMRKMPISNEEIKVCLLFCNPFLHSSVIFKKIIQNREVKYNETAKRSQDYMLWYELSQMNAKFYNINKPLVDYRLSKNQISVNHTSDQISVSGPIRGNLLKKLNPYVTEKQVSLHINICTSNSKEFKLEDKIAYLNKLNNWCKRNKEYKIYRKHCVKYAFEIIQKYNNLKQLKNISFICLSDYFNLRLLRILLIGIIRK